MAGHGIGFYEALGRTTRRPTGRRTRPAMRAVRAPIADLLADLEREFGEGKVFRPNRDVRISVPTSRLTKRISALS